MWTSREEDGATARGDEEVAAEEGVAEVRGGGGGRLREGRLREEEKREEDR